MKKIYVPLELVYDSNNWEYDIVDDYFTDNDEEIVVYDFRFSCSAVLLDNLVKLEHPEIPEEELDKLLHWQEYYYEFEDYDGNLELIWPKFEDLTFRFQEILSYKKDKIEHEEKMTQIMSEFFFDKYKNIKEAFAS